MSFSPIITVLLWVERVVFGAINCDVSYPSVSLHVIPQSEIAVLNSWTSGVSKALQLKILESSTLERGERGWGSGRGKRREIDVEKFREGSFVFNFADRKFERQGRDLGFSYWIYFMLENFNRALITKKFLKFQNKVHQGHDHLIIYSGVFYCVRAFVYTHLF